MRKPSSSLWIAAFAVFALGGIALRVVPWTSFHKLGYDEGLYRDYVFKVSAVGLSNYPDIAEQYVARQTALPAAILPPTRFLYIFCGYLWHKLTGAEALASLHHVSSLFSILQLLVATVFAWRLGGRTLALALLALMSCAPTQIHMAQHALIDGVFAFWATLCLWLLWENLRHPDQWYWLASYTAALALMVMTKENAAFVFAGIAALLLLNRWLRFGSVTPGLLLSTVAGSLLGMVLLVWLCGGLTTFIHTYKLLVSKASVLPYAIATGDGPWYRYLVDLLLVSPLILLLAMGALFRLRLTDKPSLYLLCFIVATYLVMCNVRYGMNLRYTNMWDMPLRYLALVCLANLPLIGGRYGNTILASSIAFLFLFDLRQYYVFFVQHDLYELVTGGLLQALSILK